MAPNDHSRGRPAQRIKPPSCSRSHSPSDIGATSKEKNNIVIPEFSAWLTLVLEQCRAENIRNLPRQRLPRPYFQNADPGRHAPCQSRAATTSPSQLSTSPPAFSVTAVAAPNVWNDAVPGRILSHPLQRPTHAPATSPQNKRQQRPHKTKKTKRASILVASLQWV